MAGLDLTAITPIAGEEPFTLEPFIKFMLSTRRCVPSSVFIVEGIDPIPASQSTENQAVRLLLGDGELCIQAILHNCLLQLVEKEEIYVGCYVRVEDFLLRVEEPSEYDDESRGKDGMVFLILNELQTVGWNETYVALWKRQQKGKGLERPLDRAALLPGKRPAEAAAVDDEPATSEMTAYQDSVAQRPADLGDDARKANDLFEAYEALAFPSRPPDPKAKTRSTSAAAAAAALPTVTVNARAAAAASPATRVTAPTGPTGPTAATAGTTTQQPVALPRDWHSHHVPLKLTTLRSIPHLPYAQNWSVNVLAIIVSLSDVEPSHLPPGRQRVARIADPSTSKHVHLTVFLDPEDFNPRIGSAVLLTGVKNHRFDGGSLKKYASDGKHPNGGGRRWWFEDPREMRWLDVKGIKAWWTEMENYTRTRMKEEEEEEEGEKKNKKREEKEE